MEPRYRHLFALVLDDLDTWQAAAEGRIAVPGVLVHREPRDTEVRASQLALEDSGSKRRQVYDAIVAAFRAGHTGLNDWENACLWGMNPNTERPRRRELEQAGWIIESPVRRPAQTGSGVVWTPNPEAPLLPCVSAVPPLSLVLP